MKQPTEKQKLNFPDDFLWGAATSAHQVEGGTHNQWSVWELENAKTLAERAKYELTWLPHWEESVKKLATDPDNYVSGQASDHFDRYEQDFDIVKGLNMNAFRFSIEWSRIEPNEGVWDPAAIDHYRNYIKALKSRGIEPVMTLMHWTLPTWFTDMGGFEKRRNIGYFVRFAEKVFAEYGADVRYVCTINEPEVYTSHSYYTGQWPPNKKSMFSMVRVYLNLAASHNRIAKLARRKHAKLQIGLTKNCAHHYPGDDARLSAWSAKVSEYIADYLFLDRIRKNLDWLGLNYYFSNRWYGYRVHNPNQKVSDLGWDMQPEHLQDVLERLHDKYGIPIIITENGVADREDTYRKWWIAQSILAMNRAIDNGVQLKGYLHWSLLDNFEWAYGKWPRFGLIHVDYRTGKRKPRASAIWFGKQIKVLRGLSNGVQ